MPRSMAVLGLACGVSLATASCEPPPEQAVPVGLRDAGAPGADAGTAPGSYSFVVLPDTQFYSSAWPDIFRAQTQWVVDNRAAENIAFVLHTGDIVDYDLAEQ